MSGPLPLRFRPFQCAETDWPGQPREGSHPHGMCEMSVFGSIAKISFAQIYIQVHHSRASDDSMFLTIFYRMQSARFIPDAAT